jgi:putative nucleotidyltransferase with HDIG domain
VNRERGESLVRERVANENLVRHMLATEAIMGALAGRLGEDGERWKLAGLLHDLDVEQTAETMEVHGSTTVKWLREEGLDDEEVLKAIAAHNPANGSVIESPMARALFACDPMSGLITAAALIRPERKLELVALKSLKKRFKEPGFARGARREDMLTCDELGLDLDEFLEIGLTAMQEISDELGL